MWDANSGERSVVAMVENLVVLLAVALGAKSVGAKIAWTDEMLVAWWVDLLAAMMAVPMAETKAGQLAGKMVD